MGLNNQLEFYNIDKEQSILVPYFDIGVFATSSFPSPAADYLEEVIDLSKELIHDPDATFLAKATGNSMVNDGIEEGDVLIIDRSLPLQPGKKVLVWWQNSFTVKTFHIRGDQALLVPGNPDHPTIVLDGSEIYWGRVTKIIKDCR